jgi:hypothetical protein
MASVNGVPFASMNSGSTYIPYNDGTSFVDSGFYYNGPAGYETTLLQHTDAFTTTLKLDSYNSEFTFGRATAGGISTSATAGLGIFLMASQFSLGNAETTGSSVAASWGMAIDGTLGEAIIGCGTSSPSNGVFRASSGNGAIWLGPYGVSWGVGFNTNTDSILIGSSLMSLGSYRNIIKWAQVNDELGNTYFIPLYA